MVPTDDPSKGIPTRARVRFRIGMNETQTDDTARKRARFLVPNNPKLNSDYPDFSSTHEADYEFGTFTKEESYRDLFWNNVYTVKSYIPRLQKAKAMRRRVHTGIKNVNHSGANNPFPFNNLFVRLTFTYRFLCTLITLLCLLVYSLNTVLGAIGVTTYWHGYLFAKLGKFFDWGIVGLFLTGGASWFTKTLFDTLAYVNLKITENCAVKLPNFCDDGNFDIPTYVPMGGLGKYSWRGLMDKYFRSENPEQPIPVYNSSIGINYTFPSISKEEYSKYNFNLGRLFNCVENQLAQDQECTSFNFNNDWVNGVLYAPLWFRKIKSKRKIFFNLIPLPARDRWCDGTSAKYAKGLSLCQTCAQKREIQSKKYIKPLKANEIETGNIVKVARQLNENNCYGYKCHKKAVSFINLDKGLIVPIETLRGDTVYYYKSVEYDKLNLNPQKSDELGDVKMLFATDIVLLGNLNECNPEGIPQFFKYLESTTYNMPPDLVLMDYDSDEKKIKFENRADETQSVENMGSMNFGDGGLASQPEDIDESDAVNIDREHIFTDKTGADWGNYGKDQVTETFISRFYNYLDGLTGKEYLYTTKGEIPDYGGLFYGLTCWSAYTKPKSCVNLSRICEYGVSLDESQENPVYDKEQFQQNGDWNYRNMSPDGFISYDELYDKDGRAMFATMNGNNLRTKTNRVNGFPIYDFMYLYPENFDGSLKDIMAFKSAERLPAPQHNNYGVELNSDAYLRFRYGRNREDSDIQYYDSKRIIGLYSGTFSVNKDRFPKYENSFYFYFGLKPGNTAIDKFRTLYYTECRDTDGEHPVLTVDYEGSNWCSELTNNGHIQPGDGWLKIDATYIDAPYDIYLENMSGETQYDIVIENVREHRVYLSVSENVEFEEDGFVRLFTDDTEQTPFALMSGRYRLTIKDANGEIVRQFIDFYKPYIRATVGSSPFRVKNEELHNYVPSGDLYDNTARLGGNNGENMSDRNGIGGFVKVTDVSQDGSQIVDFRVEIKPMFKISGAYGGIYPASSGAAERGRSRSGDMEPGIQTSYNGSLMEIRQQSNPETTVPEVFNVDKTLMGECFESVPPYCPYGYDFPQYSEQMRTDDGRYDLRFGVPIGGKRYQVTVTMICKKGNRYYPTRNKLVTSVTVQEPIPFKMIINGVDYEIIKNFKGGWHFEDDVVFPDNYQPDESWTDNFKGWMELDNIDGLHILDTIDTYSSNYDYDTYIKDTEAKLTNNYEYATTPYNWVGEYVFDVESELTAIDRFDVVPEERQSGVAFILVRENENSDTYAYYIWNDSLQPPQYEPYLDGGLPVYSISTKEYYDYSDLETKNDYIAKLNSVIQNRLDFVASMKSAFLMTKNETTYSLIVDNSTYEKPVYTRIFYSPDENEGTSEEYIQVGDSELEENTVFGVNVPTLTGVLTLPDGSFAFHSATTGLQDLGNYGFQLIRANGVYKKPYLVGIQNVLQETLPVEIGENENNPSKLFGAAGVVSKDMFAVHMLEKRLRVVYNLWAPMNRYFYYNERNASITHLYNRLPGLFAGFVLDGYPEYGEMTGTSALYPETNFSSQSIVGGDTDIKPTIVTLTTDENGVVLEDSTPVVRLMYSEEPYSTYGDYEYAADTVTNDNIEHEFELSNNGQTRNHFEFYGNNMMLRISESENGENIALGLFDEIQPPAVTYTDINGYGYMVEATFADGWLYTFYDGETNPFYSMIDAIALNPGEAHTCMEFTNPYMTNGDSVTGRMYFNDTNFNFDKDYSYEKFYPELTGSLWQIRVNGNSFNKINRAQTLVTDYDIYPMTSLYVVRIGLDGQRRMVSKTYDLTQMEYYIKKESLQINLYLNVTTYHEGDSATSYKSGFYYLKHYTFSITFVDNDNNAVETHVVNNGYGTASFDSTNNKYYVKVTLREFSGLTLQQAINSKLEELRGYKVQLTDITGLTKEMYQVDADTGFIHRFGLYEYNPAE